MARIKIKDLPKDMIISIEEMKKATGGLGSLGTIGYPINYSRLAYLKPAMYDVSCGPGSCAPAEIPKLK